jgi:hypothetical protein
MYTFMHFRDVSSAALPASGGAGCATGCTGAGSSSRLRLRLDIATSILCESRAYVKPTILNNGKPKIKDKPRGAAGCSMTWPGRGEIATRFERMSLRFAGRTARPDDEG